MLILIYLKKKNSLAIFVYLLIPFFADDRIGKLSNSENKHMQIIIIMLLLITFFFTFLK